MGREKRNEQRVEHWTKLIRNMMDTPAWRALSSTAQALYPWIKLEWKGAQYNNNGRLQFSVRQAAEAMGVNKDTANRAFIDLQLKGFIVVTQEARLGVGGAARSSLLEITELELPGQQGSRKLYLEWQPGGDFPARKVMAHNPRGANGKTKPCPQNGDGTVIKMGTKLRYTSPKS